MMRDVIIIGSGLAGMTAAVRLVDAGYRPIVLERNTYLGGRTASWQEGDMEVESGLHRYLGFYKALPTLLHHVGVALNDIIAWEDEVEIRHPHAPHTVLGLSPLHKPLKTITSLLANNNFLTPAEKLKVGKLFLSGAREYAKNASTLDQYSLKEYAQIHDIDTKTLEKILIPFSEGIFFLPIDQYSAHAFFGLFLPHYTRFGKTRIGAFKGGMSDVLMNPLATYIKNKGGEVRIDMPVEKLVIKKGKVRAVETPKQSLHASLVILAASLQPAQEIIKRSTDHEFFGPMLSLHPMPSVTMQLELSRPAMPIDRTTFGPTTALAAFTEQSRTTFPNTAGRLSVILSNPYRYFHTPDYELLEIVRRDAKRLGVDLDDTVIKYRKITEPHDFYLLSPGADALRPTQKTPIRGLYLAGDYTKQKYLATMEGAVVSGEIAAKHLIVEESP